MTASCHALTQRHVAGVGVLVPGLGHGAGAQQVLGRQHARGRAGIDQLARHQERVGEVAAHLVEIVQDRDHRALLGAPALDHDHEVVDGLGIDGGKRLVQQDEIGVLQQQAGEQHALELADRQRVDRPALEARQADRFDGVLGIVDVDVLGRAKAAEARPAAEQHGVEHRDREGAVDLGLLRQVGDALGRRIRCGPRCAARDRARPSRACSCRRRWGRRSPSSRLPEFPPTRDAPPDGGRSSPSGSPGAGPRSQRPPRGEPQQGRHAKCSRNASGRTHGEQRSTGRDGLMHDGNCYNIT